MISIPPSVARLLARAVARVRRIYLLRGLAAVGIVWLVSVAAAMAADARFVIFDDRIRLAMSGAIALLALLTAVLAVVLPLCRRLDVRRMAKILDARHPELDERLSTLVELSESDAAKAGFSTALFAQVSRMAERDVARIDLSRDFSFCRARRRLGVFLLLLAALVTGIVASPNLLGRLFVRVVAPWVDVGNLYSADLVVRPGNLVALAGDVIRIEATAAESLHAEPTLRISRRRGSDWSEETPEAMANGVYETTADVNEREWRYRVNAGPAVSRYYYVRVSERPRYDSFVARVDYPAYTGFPPAVYSNDEVTAIRAITGSRVRFDLNVSEEGTVADFRIGGQPVFEHQMVSNRTAEWSLELVNRDGFRSSFGRHPIVSAPDQPPTLVIESPSAGQLRLPPHAKVPVELTASDDVRAVRPEVFVSVDGGEMMRFCEVEDFASAGGRLWRGRTDLDLSRLDLASAQNVRFELVTRDECPPEFGGPHVVTSAVIAVSLEVREWGMEVKDLQQQAKEANALIDEAKRRLRDAERLARQLQNEMSREDKVSKATERKVEAAAHEAAEAEKRLQELRDRLEGDERFAPLAKPLEKTEKEALGPALERIERSPFRDRDERAGEMDKAVDELRKAQKQMDELAERLKERTEKLDAFEKTKDLAERQEALARSAQELLAERPKDLAKLDAWKRLEEAAIRRAEELLRVRQDADLAEARRKMETAARKIEELEKELKGAARPQEGVQARELHGAAKEQDRARQSLQAAADRRREERQARAANNGRLAEQKAHEAEKCEFRAEEAQRLAADHLERGEATEAVKAMQRLATEAERQARKAPQTAEKAAEAIAAQRAAEEALKREQAIREGIRKGERTEADLRAMEDELTAGLRRQAAERSAAAKAAAEAAVKAARDAAKAKDERRLGELAEAALQARADELAARLAESQLDGETEAADALRNAEDALEAVRAAAAEEEERENRIRDLQQAATDALNRSNRKRAQALQREIAKVQARAEEVVSGGEEAQSARDEANDAQVAACEATDEADRRWNNESRDAAIKAQREAMSREQAAQSAARAGRAMEKLAAVEKAGEETGERADRQDSGKSGDAQSGDEQAQQMKSGSAESQNAAKAQQAAGAAAEAMDRQVKAQAAALGLKQKGQGSGKGKPDEEPGGTGGGIGEEVAKLAKELKRNDSPDFLKALFSRLGWFKIRGLSKDGLGERDLKDVPREYRDLVRRYFLKLAEENPDRANLDPRD